MAYCATLSVAPGIDIPASTALPQRLYGVHVPELELVVCPAQFLVLHVHQRMEERIVDGRGSLLRVYLEELKTSFCCRRECLDFPYLDCCDLRIAACCHFSVTMVTPVSPSPYWPSREAFDMMSSS